MTGYAQILDQMMEAVISGDAAIAPRLLTEKEDFPARAQFAVYMEGYRLRLVGALRGLYPALLQHMGPEKFTRAAEEFITRHPSRHFNLDRYAIGFGLYVAGTAGGFAGDLARLESAVNDAYQREETPAMSAGWAQGMKVERFVAVPLRLRASACLLTFTTPAEDYYSAFREGRNCVMPAPERQWCIVLRHKRKVKRLVLEQAEYHLLCLLEKNMSLAQAVEAPEMAPFTAGAHVSSRLQAWLPRWIHEGMLRQPDA